MSSKSLEIIFNCFIKSYSFSIVIICYLCTCNKNTWKRLRRSRPQQIGAKRHSQPIQTWETPWREVLPPKVSRGFVPRSPTAALPLHHLHPSLSFLRLSPEPEWLPATLSMAAARASRSRLQRSQSSLRTVASTGRSGSLLFASRSYRKMPSCLLGLPLFPPATISQGIGKFVIFRSCSFGSKQASDHFSFFDSALREC